MNNEYILEFPKYILSNLIFGIHKWLQQKLTNNNFLAYADDTALLAYGKKLLLTTQNYKTVKKIHTAEQFM